MNGLSPNPNPSVLLIEADEALAQQMSLDLQAAGYQAVIASRGTEGLQQSLDLQPALIVVDRSLGSESGLKVCQRLRERGVHAPMLLLMTRDTVEDRIACLEAGADDYCLKPYQTETFLQLLQIYLQPEASSIEQLRFGDLLLDLATRRAFRNGRTIDLTMKEFELLKYLMENPREVLTRDQILENVWGYDFMGESNVIEVYIRYLRLKIEQEGEKRLIQTVRGVGYVLRES